MQTIINTNNAHETETTCLIASVYADQKLDDTAANIDAAMGGSLQKMITTGDIRTSLGKTTLIHQPHGLKAERLLIVGLGKADEMDAAKFNQACHAAGKVICEQALGSASSCLHHNGISTQSIEWNVRQSVIAIGHANYVYTATKKPKPEDPKVIGTLEVLVTAQSNEIKRAVAHAQAIVTGYTRARELGNLPPNICTPVYLAKQGQEIADKYANCSYEALNTEQMQALGMNALLGVARGSRNPPRLIILRYMGADKDQPPVVLVGKGITFDTGGISLKPGANMDQMKYDMCGAAGVIGTFEACAEMQLAINLVVLVAAAENMPDGDAYRPGDVIESMDGQTIEVLNTDAEGRMVLCDALTYAKRFEPAALIDIATLTGACVIALGHHASGLMSKSDELADELLDAGQEIIDRAWRMPIWDEYQSQLDTPFADMQNIGGMPAGSLTAGCFLSRFTKDQNWAHLDIAGSAWKWGTQEGATGRPVALLSQFLINRCK